MSYNYILKESEVNRLLGFIENDNEIKRFWQDSFDLGNIGLIPAPIFAEDAPPLISPKIGLDDLINPKGGFRGIKDRSVTKHDFDNSRALYEALKISRVQASDSRLWAYLSLGPYFSYIRKRYVPRTKKQKILLPSKYYEYNSEEQKTIRSYIQTRFFTGTDNRTLRRNAISSLWWATELTYAPWERWTGFPEVSNDKYYYSKIILSDTDLFLNVFERTFGKDNKIIFPLIDVFAENNFTREQKRIIYKKINTDLAFRNYSVIEYKEIKSLIKNWFS